MDDIGAIAVIALFYAGTLDPLALGLAAAAALASVGLRRARVHWAPLHVALGVGCWLATYNSGVHPTIAGVAFGLLTPARPLAPAVVARRWTQDMSDEPSAAELRQLMTIAKETVSPAERLQHLLHPLTSFVIVPVFALANAGVVIRLDALEAPGAVAVAVGVTAGLVIGKLVGVAGATWLAVRTRVGTLPPDVGWRAMAGVGALAGIGFTVSLFVTGLAFDQVELRDAAKLGVLVASVAASALLLDFVRPTRGSCTLLGGSGADPAVRARVGYLPAELRVDPTYTAQDLIDFYGALRGGVDRGHMQELLERFELDPRRPYRELSTGNRRKVGIIQAFMHRPELLLLDEPTSGLDPLLQVEFGALMHEANQAGATVLLSSHVVREVEALADRVAILRRGRLVATVDIDELRRRGRQRLDLLSTVEPILASSQTWRRWSSAPPRATWSTSWSKARSMPSSRSRRPCRCAGSSPTTSTSRTCSSPTTGTSPDRRPPPRWRSLSLRVVVGARRGGAGRIDDCAVSNRRRQRVVGTARGGSSRGGGEHARDR